MKIGIILPQSIDYPFLAKGFLNGFDLVSENLDHITYLKRYVSKGEPKELISAYRELIVDEEVELIVAFNESFIVPDIKNLIYSTQIPCIITGMGARLPFPKIAGSPFIFYHTYQIWESNWLAGRNFIQENVDDYAILCSFFDSGYPSAYACVQGASEGQKQPKFVSITHKDNFEAEWNKVENMIAEIDPKFFYLAYFGRERNDIIEKLLKLGIEPERIITSPGIANGKDEVSRVASWYPDLKIKENIEFKKMYSATYGKKATEFAVLGWEVANLIALNTKPDEFERAEFLNSMIHSTFKGPRGKINFIPETNSSYLPHYLISEKGARQLEYPVNELIEEINKNIITNQLGWHNTYLCR
ncbi:MAG: ABC transporter substrate-binding protein [Bacteroidales bacterium]|nr:ABC transporter substrate-binding protein [Bacteroidales bacterium]